MLGEAAMDKKSSGKTKLLIAFFGLLGTGLSAASGAYVSRLQSEADKERSDKMLAHLQSTIASQRIQLRKVYKLLSREVTLQGKLLERHDADMETIKKFLLPTVVGGSFPKDPPSPGADRNTLPPSLKKPSKSEVNTAQRDIFKEDTVAF
jgi:VIT1/CCC1 family predicted Fe2+/Mn2+ transporter